MAKESVNILKDKIDIVDLLAQLNAALSEEWVAFYQYWVGSFVVEGAMRGDVQREFQEHAAEEYNHAKLLADRIIELEGVPVLDPKQWFDLARCKYDAPVDFGSEILLKQNVSNASIALQFVRSARCRFSAKTRKSLKFQEKTLTRTKF